MAKERSPEDLAYRAFVMTMAGLGTFIAVVFLFILR
jgi:hypothetical protein